MTTAAIIGAGDLGGAIAHSLATRESVSRVLLVDDQAGVAAGKALDILQAGAIQGFHTTLQGTADLDRIAGCSVCLIADRAGSPAREWDGEEALSRLTRIAALADPAPMVMAGIHAAPVMASAVREAGLNRARLVGSASEAVVSAVRAIVALEARCSPAEVMLTVLGAPGGFVVPWSEASIGGYRLDQVLTPVELTRLDARMPRLWPPGPYALGLAASRVAEAILRASRATFSLLTVLDGTAGPRHRVGAMPVLLAPSGIVHIRTPSLSTRERVLVDTALGR